MEHQPSQQKGRLVRYRMRQRLGQSKIFNESMRYPQKGKDEEGAGTAQRPHLERIHRLAWRDLLAKVEAAAMAAGFDMAPTGEPQSASEAIVGVGVQVETNRRSEAIPGSAGRGLRPSPKVRQEEL